MQISYRLQHEADCIVQYYSLQMQQHYSFQQQHYSFQQQHYSFQQQQNYMMQILHRENQELIIYQKSQFSQATRSCIGYFYYQNKQPGILLLPELLQLQARGIRTTTSSTKTIVLQLLKLVLQLLKVLELLELLLELPELLKVLLELLELLLEPTVVKTSRY